MELSLNTRPQPWFWRYIPWLNKHRGSCLFGKWIILRPDIYKNLQSKNPNPESISILIHEQTHLNRIKQIGTLKWGIKYLVYPKFRFNEELAATKFQFKYLKSKGIIPDFKKRAKILSSWQYLRPVSYKYAFEKLEQIWEDS